MTCFYAKYCIGPMWKLKSPTERCVKTCDKAKYMYNRKNKLLLSLLPCTHKNMPPAKVSTFTAIPENINEC